jgi:YfiH family protein
MFLRQVHGARAVWAQAPRAPSPSRHPDGAPPEADAIVSGTPGLAVGVVTADCVPILVASVDGRRVAAIHAGWRGLAAGVIERGIEAMEVAPAQMAAAIGPAARGCCYEVDEPVTRALAQRYAEHLPGVLVPGRPDRHQLDLPALARRILHGLGLAPDLIGLSQCHCTICTPGPRFESYRRDGAAAGRLRHFIAPTSGPAPDRAGQGRAAFGAEG